MPYAIAKMGLPIDASGNAVAVARQPRSCLKLPAGDGTMPLSVASRMVLSQRCLSHASNASRSNRATMPRSIVAAGRVALTAPCLCRRMAVIRKVTWSGWYTSMSCLSRGRLSHQSRAVVLHMQNAPLSHACIAEKASGEF